MKKITDRGTGKASCFAVAFAGALWGTNGFFIKNLAALGVDNSCMVSFLRFTFAGILMGVLVFVREGKKAFAVKKCTLFCCALLGLLCHAVYNVLYALGCETAGMALTAVLVNMAPVFTLLFSAIVYKEKMTFQKSIAILINVTGCVCCATNGHFDIENISVTGILIGVGAAVVYSTSAIIGRYSKEEVSPFVVCFYCFLFADLFLLPFTKFWDGTFPLNWKVMGVSIGYSLVPTLLSYVFYYGGIKKITESSKVPVLTSVEMVVTVLIAMLVFHEKIGVVSLTGVILVLCSIMLMNLKGIVEKTKGLE